MVIVPDSSMRTRQADLQTLAEGRARAVERTSRRRSSIACSHWLQCHVGVLCVVCWVRCFVQPSLEIWRGTAMGLLNSSRQGELESPCRCDGIRYERHSPCSSLLTRYFHSDLQSTGERIQKGRQDVTSAMTDGGEQDRRLKGVHFTAGLLLFKPNGSFCLLCLCFACSRRWLHCG